MGRNNKLKLLVFLALGILVLPYQNCGSPSGSGLNLGSAPSGTPLPGSVFSAALNPSTQSTSVNASAVLFNAGTNGGTAPFTYSWSISPTTGANISGCTNQSFCSPLFTQVGTYALTVTAGDSIGLFAQATATINVTQTGPSPTPSPAPTPTPPPGGAACPTSYGWVDVAYMDQYCTLHVAGWGWNPQGLQNTRVLIQTSEPGITDTTTVSVIRDDVNAVYACIPTSPVGKPGFSITIPFAYSRTGVMGIVGYVLNPNNSVDKILNTISINVYQQQPQCVYLPNNCPPNNAYCDSGGGG